MDTVAQMAGEEAGAAISSPVMSALTHIVQGMRGAVLQDKTPVAWMAGALTLLITSYHLSPGRKLVQILPPPRMRRIFVAPSPSHTAAAPPHSAKGAATATATETSTKETAQNADSTANATRCAVQLSSWRKFVFLFRIAFPSWHSRECYTLLLQTLLMLVRAFLSVGMARITGRMAKASIARRMPALMRLLSSFALYFVPASLCDSTLDYLGQMQQLHFRENLARYFHTRYLQPGVFYSLAGMHVVSMIDQRLTEDINRWAGVSSRVLTSITRPLIEAVQFTSIMYHATGVQGPALTWSYYMGFCIFAVLWAPNIDWMAAQRMSNEGAYQDAHRAALAYAEEITLMQGQRHEATVLSRLFDVIANQTRYAAFVHARFNLIEMLYNRYGSVLVCYGVMSMALLRETGKAVRDRRGTAVVSVEEQLIRYAELSFVYKVLAQAIGRLLWNIKLVLAINGYTQRLYQFVEGLELAETERSLVVGSTASPSCCFTTAAATATTNTATLSVSALLLLSHESSQRQEKQHAGVLALLDSVQNLNKEQLLSRACAQTALATPLSPLCVEDATNGNTSISSGADDHADHGNPTATTANNKNESNSKDAHTSDDDGADTVAKQGVQAVPNPAMATTLANLEECSEPGTNSIFVGHGSAAGMLYTVESIPPRRRDGNTIAEAVAVKDRLCVDEAEGCSNGKVCEANAQVMSPLPTSPSYSTLATAATLRMIDCNVVATTDGRNDATTTTSTPTLPASSSTDPDIHQNNHANNANRKTADRTPVNIHNKHSSNHVHAENGTDTESAKSKKCQTRELAANASSPPRGTIVRDEHIEFIHVPLILPTGETLCSSLSFYVKPGMNLLIVGPNGCGKTSTFRLLGELWPLRGGTIVKPERSQMYYLPQRPYMYDGTLFEQIIYPTSRKCANVSESELYECLRMAGLEYIFDRPQVSWNAHISWSDDSFSIGEKQRLAMARLFFHRPRFAILDECSSTLDHATERQFYEHCRAMGITTITIAHRRSVWGMHNWVLYFDGNGGYMFAPLQLTSALTSSASASSAATSRLDAPNEHTTDTTLRTLSSSSISLILAGVVSASDTSLIGKVVPIHMAGGESEDEDTMNDCV